MSQEHFDVHFRVTKRAVNNLIMMAVGAAIFSGAMAFADGDLSTQTVVGTDLIMPYDGYLMVDSAPLTGVRTIKFDLYQDATGGNVVWTETQTVNLYNGRFSVGLGSASSLTATILDAEKLYLSMTIVETDAQGNSVEIELSGRQSIEPAPFAAWAANSADFNVAGDLTVAGDEIKLGSNGANALFQNGNDQLYISPSKGHSGGVYVGNDFYTNYDTRLGPSDASGSTRIFGPESDGSTTAALRILNSSGGTMFIDTNEIDSTGTLRLQENTANDIILGGDTYIYDDRLILQDADGDSYVLTGVDTAYDDTGVELRTMNNPASGSPLFTVLSSGGSERLRVEHDGVVHTDNGLNVEGSTTLGDASGDTVTTSGNTTVGGNLTVNGNFTNFDLNLYALTVNGSNGTGEKDLEDTGLDNSYNGTRTSMCFLLDVRFDDLDSDEFHTCTIDQVVDSTGTKRIWQLGAEINGGGGEIYCQAGCFSWNN